LISSAIFAQLKAGSPYTLQWTTTPHHNHNCFYGPFSGITQVSQCQKRTSGLYGARED